MKKVLFICSLFLSTLSFAQKEQAAVAKAVESLRVLMITPNKAKLEALTADSLSYGHSGGSVQGKAEFIESLTSGKSDFVTIDLSNQTIRVVGDLAIVRHTLSAHTKDMGKPEADIKLAILTIWQKQKGAWKFIARQAVHVDGK
jgi:ketosteroid isomerase-like protein